MQSQGPEVFAGDAASGKSSTGGRTRYPYLELRKSTPRVTDDSSLQLQNTG